MSGAKEIVGKLRCWISGHTYTPKVVLAGEYVSASIQTCDRCGNGQDDFDHARTLALAVEHGARQRRALTQGEGEKR